MENNIKLDSKETLEERFSRERLEWTEKIKDISKRLHVIFDIPELMTTLYTERQRAAEYYHYLITLLIALNKKYNAAYAEKYDYYTNKVQIRYPTESSKHNRIQTDLADLVEKKAIIENHSKFIDQCIRTIDAIIYAIPKRIEIEQIARGK